MSAPMWRRSLSPTQQRNALKDAADVMASQRPCHETRCAVWRGSELLNARVEWRWPGVLRVTLENTGDLVAESEPGRPNELRASAAGFNDADAPARVGRLTSAAIRQTAERAWQRSQWASEQLQQSLAALRAKTGEEAQDPEMESILARIDGAAAESETAAHEAVMLLAAQFRGLD